MQNLIPEDKARLIKQAQDDMDNRTKDLKIVDDATLQTASHILGEVKVRIKRLDELKNELTKPMADAVKSANNWFKMQKQPFEKIELYIKGLIGDYTFEVERLAMEARKKAEAEQKELEDAQKKLEAEAKKKNEPAPEPVAPLAPMEKPKVAVQTEHGKVITKKLWTYDIEDETKIPREFLTVDRAKVTQAVRNGERDIKGIKIYQKVSVAI